MVMVTIIITTKNQRGQRKQDMNIKPNVLFGPYGSHYFLFNNTGLDN